MRRGLRTLLLCALLSACSSSPEPAGFDFDADPRARQIEVATKTVEAPAGVVADRVFVNAAPGTANEILPADDPGRAAGAGHRLLVWDTADAGESADSVHYVFVLDTGGARVDAARLASLQAQLSARLGEQRLSPFYFAGKMSEAYAYPPS
ncbi:hypothetical protein [Solimonas flava]|uniref:hypothetical protein n=1 Tax=Solimonas flava TaxID=415849 RepID=UPI0004164759|nr:hypothetical protein [Solimonas flava]